MVDEATQFAAACAWSDRSVPHCDQCCINVSTSLCFTSQLSRRCCHPCTTRHRVKVAWYVSDFL